MADLSREEFLIHIGYIREQTEVIRAHVEKQNGRLGDLEEDVTRHDERLKSVESENKRDPMARWTGVAAIAGGVLWEAWKKATGSH